MKTRAYTVTVHHAHDCFRSWVLDLGTHYEEGNIDYAAISHERSKDNKEHLNAFVVFNERCQIEKKENNPTDYLKGSWQKAKSLTGARDYCLASGIHYQKPGVINIFEVGEWVDPGFNINIKFRKQYQFSEMIKEGYTANDIAKHEPAAALMVGLKQLEDLAIRLSGMPPAALKNEPYYYIGLDNWEDLIPKILSKKLEEEE